MYYSEYPSGCHRKSQKNYANCAGINRARINNIGSKSLAGNDEQPLASQGFAGFSLEACLVGDSTPLPIHLPIRPPTPSKAPPTAPHTRPHRSRILQAAIDAVPNPYRKPWRNLWPYEKAILSFEAAGQSGGLAFTLNLSAKRQQMLMCRADPANDLRRYIAREMRTAFGTVLPFSFAFEVAPGGKLHVHGVIIPRNKSTTHVDAIKQALARAGGKIDGRGAARQVVLETLSDGAGWAAYSQKAFDDACRHLGTNKIISTSKEITRLTREIHKERSLAI